MKENLHTKYFPFTYNDVTFNEKPPIMKENLCIFIFIIGGIKCNTVHEMHITITWNETLFAIHKGGVQIKF